MNFKNKQQGMSMIGLVMFMSLLAFVVYAGIRLGPIYNEYYAVVKAMKLVANKAGSASKSPSELKAELVKSLWSSYVDKERVNSKHVKIIRSRGKQLQVKYDVQEPFIGNLDFLIHFEKQVPLK